MINRTDAVLRHAHYYSTCTAAAQNLAQQDPRQGFSTVDLLLDQVIHAWQALLKQTPTLTRNEALLDLATSIAFVGRNRLNIAITYIPIMEQRFQLALHLKRDTIACDAAGSLGAAYSDLGNSELSQQWHIKEHYYAELIQDPRRIATAALHLSADGYERGDLQQAQSLAEKARKLAHIAQFPQQEARALLQIAVTMIARGLTNEAIAIIKELHSIVGVLNDYKLQLEVSELQARLLEYKGNISHACAILEQLKLQYHTLGFRRDEGRIIGSLARLHMQQGNYAAAHEVLLLRIQIARAEADLRGLATGLGNLVVFYGEQHQVATAVSVLHEQIMYLKQLGDERMTCVALINAGNLAADCGDWKQAQLRAEESLRYIQVGKTIAEHIDALVLHARALWHQHEQRRAYVELQEAAQLAHYHNLLRASTWVLNTYGDLLAHAGKFKQAEPVLRAALKRANQLGDQRRSMFIQWSLGLVLLDLNRKRSAISFLDAAVAYEQHIGDPDATEHAAFVATLHALL